MPVDLRGHWEGIYGERKTDEVGWYQEVPTRSLELIRDSLVPKVGSLIDVGGGASRVVDSLLEAGYVRVSVLDISPRALAHSKERLGARADRVEWIEADVTNFVSTETYDLWHDRAAFHFLTEESDRMKYVDCARKSLRPGGIVILAAFASNGPETCSGLPVRRYDARLVSEAFGSGFELQSEEAETHLTPWKTEQRFSYFVLKRK